MRFVAVIMSGCITVILSASEESAYKITADNEHVFNKDIHMKNSYEITSSKQKQMKVGIKKLNANAIVPSYGSEFAAGADLYACLEADLEVKPHQTVLVSTGIALELPLGYAGLIYARSGLATKKGLAPANKVGVVDCDYRGEVKVALHNHSEVAQTVSVGERVAQLVITPYLTAEFVEKSELSATVRGAGGFGSTGTK